MTTCTRNDFANKTADAYVRQFGIDSSPVMNQMVITWDGYEFLAGSSLSVTDSEVVVLELEDGMFGSEGLDTDEIALESIYDHLTDKGNNASDELWREVLDIIEQFARDE